VACGEKLSAALLDELLRARGISSTYVDASRCIITDDEHGRATPQFEITNTRIVDEISPLLEMGVIPVLGGFISSTVDGGHYDAGAGRVGLHGGDNRGAAFRKRDTDLDRCHGRFDGGPPCGSHKRKRFHVFRIWRRPTLAYFGGKGPPSKDHSSGGAAKYSCSHL